MSTYVDRCACGNTKTLTHLDGEVCSDCHDDDCTECYPTHVIDWHPHFRIGISADGGATPDDMLSDCLASWATNHCEINESWTEVWSEKGECRVLTFRIEYQGAEGSITELPDLRARRALSENPK